MVHEKVVIELINKMNSEPEWLYKFNEALSSARSSGICEVTAIKSLTNCYASLDSLILWVPCEDFPGTDVCNHFCLFCLVLDKPIIKPFQTHVLPGPNPKALSWLSNWMVQYPKAMGSSLETPESITPESLKNFISSPN